MVFCCWEHFCGTAEILRSWHDELREVQFAARVTAQCAFFAHVSVSQMATQPERAFDVVALQKGCGVRLRGTDHLNRRWLAGTNVSLNCPRGHQISHAWIVFFWQFAKNTVTPPFMPISAEQLEAPTAGLCGRWRRYLDWRRDRVWRLLYHC